MARAKNGAVDALDSEAAERLKSAAPDVLVNRAQELQAEADEVAQERTGKRGRPSKAAKQAEQEKELRTLLESALAPINRGVPSEFQYTPDEMEILVTYGARVLAKYADDNMLRYGDEITLAVFLAATLTNKTGRYAARRKAQNDPIFGKLKVRWLNARQKAARKAAEYAAARKERTPQGAIPKAETRP